MIDRSECYRLDRKLLRASYYFMEKLIEKPSDMSDDYRDFGFELQISQQRILQNLECMPSYVIWNSNWQSKMTRMKSTWNFNLYTRGAQVPGSRSPPRINLLICRLIFVGSRYGTCFVSLFWPPEFWSGSKVFLKVCAELLQAALQNVSRKISITNKRHINNNSGATLIFTL